MAREIDVAHTARSVGAARRFARDHRPLTSAASQDEASRRLGREFEPRTTSALLGVTPAGDRTARGAPVGFVVAVARRTSPMFQKEVSDG